MAIDGTSNTPSLTRRAANRASLESAVDPTKIPQGLTVDAAKKPEVRELQRFLNENGCRDEDGNRLKTDSVFGPKTKAALEDFQTKNHLEPTGFVDAPTLRKLQGKDAPVAEAPVEPAAGEPVGPKASKADVEASRTRMKSREDLMRARVEGADRADKRGEKYDVVSDANVQKAADTISEIKGSITERRASIVTAREAIQKDVVALQSKANRTEPEEMLLTGKRTQEEVLGQFDKHLATKGEVMDAALGAVSDGIITAGENRGLQQATHVMAAQEQMLAVKAAAADQVVATAQQLGAKVPTAATPAVTTPAAGALSQQQVNAAVLAVAQGVGTDKSKIHSATRIFTALEGKTPAQLDQIKQAYNDKYGRDGWDFDTNVRGNMHSWNKQAFDALAAGKTDDFMRLRPEGAVKDREVNARTRTATFEEPATKSVVTDPEVSNGAVKTGPRRGLNRLAVTEPAGEPPKLATPTTAGPPKVATPTVAEPPKVATPPAAEPPRAATPTAAEPPNVATPLAAGPPKIATPTAAEPPKAATPLAAGPPNVATPPAAEPPRAATPTAAGQAKTATPPPVVAATPPPAASDPVMLVGKLDALRDIGRVEGGRSARPKRTDAAVELMKDMTPSQIADLKKTFAASGHDFDREIRSRMTGYQQERLVALEKGDRAGFDSITSKIDAGKRLAKAADDAMGGQLDGTDEAKLFTALTEGGQDPMLKKIMEQEYTATSVFRGGQSMDTAMKSELSGDELIRGQALWANKPALAHAAYAHEKLEPSSASDLKEATRHLNSIAGNREAADAFKAQYGTSLRSFVLEKLADAANFNIDATTRAQLRDAAMKIPE